MFSKRFMLGLLVAALAVIGLTGPTPASAATSTAPAVTQDIFYAGPAPVTDDIFYAFGCSSCYGVSTVNTQRATSVISNRHNAPIQNYSARKWGATGIVAPYSTSLGYDYLMELGGKGRGTGFWVGGNARLRVATYGSNGWRTIRGPGPGGTFTYGQWLFGDDNLYSIERVA